MVVHPAPQGDQGRPGFRKRADLRGQPDSPSLGLWERMQRFDSAKMQDLLRRRRHHHFNKDTQKEIASIRKRLRDSNRMVVLPTSKFALRWDILTFCALVFTMVVTPVEVSFLSPKFDALFVLYRLVDVIFICDLVLQFFLGYYDESRGNILIQNRHLITRHYLSSWFLTDLISSIPLDLLTMFLPDDEVRGRKVLRMLRLLKVVRVLRLSRMQARWEVYAVFQMTYAMMGITKLTATIIIFAHWCACLWGLAAHPAIIGEKQWSWIKERNKQLRSPDNKIQFRTGSALHVYTASVYFAIYTMTGIGYGDVVPTTHLETAVSVFLMAISAVFWAFMIATFCSIVASMNAHESQYRQRMDDLNMMMRDRKFPSELKTRCRMFLINSKNHQRTSGYQRLENLFSISLRGDVAAAVNEPWIKNVWYLREASTEFIIELSQSLTSIMFAPMEPIDIALSLFILQNGIVAHGGKILSKGSIWGAEFIMREVDLIDRTIGAALSYVLVTCISRDDFFAILQDPIFEKERTMVAKANTFYALKMRMMRLAMSYRRRETMTGTHSHKTLDQKLTPKVSITNVVRRQPSWNSLIHVASANASSATDPPYVDALSTTDCHVAKQPPYLESLVKAANAPGSTMGSSSSETSNEHHEDSLDDIRASQMRLECLVSGLAMSFERVNRTLALKDANNVQRGQRRLFVSSELVHSRLDAEQTGHEGHRNSGMKRARSSTDFPKRLQSRMATRNVGGRAFRNSLA